MSGALSPTCHAAVRNPGHDPDSEEVWHAYRRSESEVDANIRARDLDWTILRPGGLTDEPGNREGHGRRDARADVAALIVMVLDQGRDVRSQFEVLSGDVPISDVAV